MADDFAGSTTTTGAVTVGGSAAGNLEVGADRDWFRITLVAGQSYIFNLDRITLSDPFLVLYDQNGVDIVGNDDIVTNVNLNSQIRFTATVSGTYYLGAFSSNGSATGTYTLRAAIDPSPPVVTDDYGAQAGSPNVGTVAIGGSTTGNLETLNDRDWFAVTLVAGTSYTFRQNGGTLADPKLFLRDGNGILITGNDDSGGTLNSLINYTATATGVYYLEANTADVGNAAGIGTYTVLAAVNGSPPPPPVDDFGSQVGAGNLGSVTVGGSSTGLINFGGDRDFFAVTLSVGSQYRIRQEVGTLPDPRFTLRNAIGVALTGDDDSGGGQNAQVDFTATASGIYYIDANSGSGTDTGTYTVRVTLLYGAPVIVNNTGSTGAEGATDIVTSSELSTTDPDSAASAIVYTLTTLATNGTLTRSGTAIALNGTFTQADINANLIAYVHNGSETTSGSFGFSVTDGTTNFTGRTFNFTVTPVNDAPTITGLLNDNAATSESGSAVPNTKIDFGGNVVVGDSDNANFGGGSIRFAITSGLVAAQDQLVIDTSAATTVTIGVGIVSVGGVAIGTVTGGGAGGADLVIALGTAATPARVQTLIRAIDFANTGGDNPTAGARTITTTLIDGGGTANGGADTRSVTSTVNVNPVNDAPTLTGTLAVATFTPGVATNVDASATTIADVDSPTLTATIRAPEAVGSFTAAAGAGVTLGGSGTTLTVTGTAAAINAYLDTPANVQFTPSGNGTFSIFIIASDGLLNSSGTPTALVTSTFTPISITGFAAPITQNFDALINSGVGGITPAGWTVAESSSNADGYYSAGTGSSLTGDAYSFGASGSTERALGGVGSAILVPTIGAAFTNNSGAIITSLVVSYTGEQWRLGATGRTDRLDFQYSVNATDFVGGTWTDVNALDFNAPQSTGVAGVLDGNAAANRTPITFEITGLNIAAGATFYFRWSEFNAAGAEDGLAIDDFSLVARSLIARGDTGAVNENATITNGNLFANDASAGGAPALAVAQVNGNAANVGTQITLASGALLTVNANGTYSYNPNGAFNYLIDAATAATTGATNTSATDSFTYTLTGAASALQTATVTVTINGVAGTGDQLRGGAGIDTINGTALDDFLNLSQGGNDTVTGGAGNDAFLFGPAFTIADNVDGGPGTNDQVGLQGDYATIPLTLGAGSLVNVEVLAALPGFSYNVTSVDANVPAGQELSVFGGNLLAGNNFTFNGGAETDGRFRMFGGLGNDTFIGGALDDGFYFGPGKWGASDAVSGGGGTNDQLALDGNYSITINGGSADVETLILLPGPAATPNAFNIALADSWTPAAATRTVWGLNVTTAMTLDGSAETNGILRFFGGQAADTITGGAGNDYIFGNTGGDTLRGGAGADTFFYDAVAQSSSVNYDRLLDFDYTTDRIQISGQVHDTYVAVGGGTLSTATFDADLATSLNAALSGGNAVFFTPDAGTLAGRAFLVVDANGINGYQAGEDYVFEVPNPPPALPPVDFIIA